MSMVFLSYATRDFLFAELASIKLGEAGVSLWRDQAQLRPGTDWRGGIEQGIAESLAVLVALSENSAASSYVTFEWAYGLGKGKPVIPLKLGECKVHPRLEPVQYLDFSIPASLPWALLIERIREVETEASPEAGERSTRKPLSGLSQDELTATQILAYLDQRGYQMASFEALRARVSDSMSDADFQRVIKSSPDVLRTATLRGGKPGLAKVVP